MEISVGNLCVDIGAKGLRAGELTKFLLGRISILITFSIPFIIK